MDELKLIDCVQQLTSIQNAVCELSPDYGGDVANWLVDMHNATDVARNAANKIISRWRQLGNEQGG